MNPILAMIAGGGTFQQVLNQQRRPAGYQKYQMEQIAAKAAKDAAKKKKETVQKKEDTAPVAESTAPVEEPVVDDGVEINIDLPEAEPVPEAPSSVKQDPITIRNPAKRKVRGGIAQFATSSGGSRTLPTIKSKLLNV